MFLENEDIMAAAEARAAWQRTANHCLVQEDAKRAPKLACCPSSSSTQQYDSSNDNVTSGQDPSAPNLMSLNLPPDTQWWLQSNFGYQKDFTCEELDALDDELRETNVETTVPTSEQLVEPLLGGPMDIDSDYERNVDEMKTVTSNLQQPPKGKIGTYDYFYQDEELMDWKSVDGLFSNKPEDTCLDNKCEPWWRFADKYELASFVAQKSQQHIENCDLPRPTQISKNPFAWLDGLDSNKIFSSSAGRKLFAGTSELGLCDTEKLTSGTPPESRPASESDSSKAQLLEALRHSQTRAREAEMAAQKAYNEKEHIVKLLFRQASHIFAYKQWLQLLQLESLCLQLRIKDHRLRMLFPVLPWKQLKRKEKKQRKCNVCKCAVVFAIGLGLAGSGLLLGWRLGCLGPTFYIATKRTL